VLCSLPLGEAYLLAGRLEEAHALALAEALGMRPRAVHCRALELTFWLPQAEAALAQVEGQ
jgi:hypothetical protein